MSLPFRTFPTIVATAAAAVQGAAGSLLDLSVGSTLRAMLEAHAGVALWLQWLIAQLLQTTRAATSTGADLDTWVGDFKMTRLPAVSGEGRVQLSRFVAVGAAHVPAGLTVRTSDGSQMFTVMPEPGHAAWDVGSYGFALSPGVVSVDVPVVAAVAGAAGNVQAGSIALISAAAPGIDTVANAQPMSGGVDAESDPALRARFQLFVSTLARATPLSVQAAVLGTRQGLTVAVRENVLPDGTPRMGFFSVIVDDGTGNPAASVLTAAAAAVEAVRPVGAAYAVVPPTIATVAVRLQVVAGPQADRLAVVGRVAAALTAFVNALPVGAPLPCSRVAQVAYDADPGVANVLGVTLGGGTADLSVGPGSVIKLSTLEVA